MKILPKVLTTSLLVASMATTGGASAEIIINGESYEGQNLRIVGSNGSLTIDGNAIQIDDRIINIQVNGDLDQLQVSTSNEIVVNGTVGFLETKSGNVKTGDVLGDIVTQSGNVTTGAISGNVKTMSGNISYEVPVENE